MMLYIAVILLFVLATVSLYALIKSKHNSIIMMLLIPSLLASTLYSGWAIFALQGTPRKGLPDGEVEVLWVDVMKPYIHFTVREPEEITPTYWVIPYTKENAKKMQQVGEQAEGMQQMGQALKGKFSKKRNDESESDEVNFDKIKRTPLPPKQALQNHGVDPGIVNHSRRQSSEPQERNAPNPDGSIQYPDPPAPGRNPYAQ